MRARKPRLEARKRPVQRRSRATVADILAAAAQVFERYGLAAGTTNRIAERAGVSIGTLYQYFPGKEAIAAALLEQHVEETVQLLNALVASAAAQRPTLREGLERYVSSMLALHGGRPRLQHMLLEEIPRSPALHRREVAAKREAIRTVSELLSVSPFAQPHLERAAGLAVDAVESLTHRYAAHPETQVMSEAEFVAELVTMLEGYVIHRRERGGEG